MTRRWVGRTRPTAMVVTSVVLGVLALPSSAGAGFGPEVEWTCREEWQQSYELLEGSGEILEMSDDGTTVVFSATDDLTSENPDHGTQMFASDLTTDGVVQLPTPASEVQEAVVTDDGSIVYRRLRNDTIQKIVVADGTVEELPLSGVGLSTDDTGSHLVGSSSVLDVDAGTVTNVTSPDGHPVQNMAINGDGTRLVVATVEPLPMPFAVDVRLYLVDAGSGNVIQAVDPDVSQTQLHIADDGELVSIGRDGEGHELWNLDTGTLIETRGATDLEVLADGSAVYSTSVVTSSSARILSLPSAAASAIPVDAFSLGGGRIAVSGDGSTMAVGPPTSGIFLVDQADGTSTRIAAAAAPGAQRSVTTQSGDEAIYVATDPTQGNDDGGTELWAASASGLELLTDLGVGWFAGAIQASADGQDVVFFSTADPMGQNPRHLLEVFLLQRTSPPTIRQITSGGLGRQGAPAISGDGSRIAFTSERDLVGSNADGSDELFVYDLAADELVQASDTITAGLRLGRPALDDAGDLVALRGPFDPVAQNADHSTELFLYRPEDDQLQQVTAAPGGAVRRAEDTTVDAEGRQVLYGSPIDPVTGAISGSGQRARLHDAASGTTSNGVGTGLSEGPWLVADGTSYWGQYGAQVFRWNLTTGLQTVVDGDADALSANGHHQVHLEDHDETVTGTTCWSFVDVTPDHAFWDDVEWAADRAIVSGYGDQTFRPSASVTRQAMAAFLYRLAGADEPAPTDHPFDDVSTTHPFATEIAWASGEGITTGFPDGTFRPSAVVTRQAAAAFLHRLVDPTFDPPGTATFTDVGTSHPFFAEIEWAADEQITTGYPDHTFRPAAVVTRQAAAAFLHRTEPLL